MVRWVMSNGCCKRSIVAQAVGGAVLSWLLGGGHVVLVGLSCGDLSFVVLVFKISLQVGHYSVNCEGGEV